MRFLTAGESHGPNFTAIVEGFPAGMYVDIEEINKALKIRQQGYGRGRRMQIESDEVQILSGVRDNITLGTPITLQIQNKDYSNWQNIMNSQINDTKQKNKRAITKPRPGHADLVGGQKRRFKDLRNVLERSSARETAIIVAIGNLCEQKLKHLGIKVFSYVTQIGKVIDISEYDTVSFEIDSALRMRNKNKLEEAKKLIDIARENGTTLGGKFCVEVHNLPAGIGDYTQWDLKLDSRLARAVMSLNGVKSVEIGDVDKLSTEFGAHVMDEITYKNYFSRASNYLGGIEGGMSNGMPIVLKGVMKPIPTQYQPLQSIDIHTKESVISSVERSDTCVVPACSFIAQNIVARVICEILLEQFDNVEFHRLQEQYSQYIEEINNY